MFIYIYMYVFVGSTVSMYIYIYMYICWFYCLDVYIYICWFYCLDWISCIAQVNVYPPWKQAKCSYSIQCGHVSSRTFLHLLRFDEQLGRLSNYALLTLMWKWLRAAKKRPCSFGTRSWAPGPNRSSWWRNHSYVASPIRCSPATQTRWGGEVAAKTL